MNAELAAQLRERARELGFSRMGIAAVTHLQRDVDALHAWLAAGHHGEMRWMAESAEVRADPAHPKLLGGARSVVVLATPYARPPETEGPTPGIVARYARGRDYHNFLKKKTWKLARILVEVGFAARPTVDTFPILERAWAQRAGVGFIGKNCCLIVPGLGSHVLLSTVVTSAELPPDAPMRERCGSCRACLDACPTVAFVAAHELDARRCIAYLTIESKRAVPEALRAKMGPHLFGCDVCQDVCPFNQPALNRHKRHRRTGASPDEPETTRPFAAHPRLAATKAEDLLTMDEATFLAWAEGSPMRRPGRAGMARNAAIVLGNRGERRHLPVLRATATAHDSAMVRQSAAWAAGQLARRLEAEGTSGKNRDAGTPSATSNRENHPYPSKTTGE